MNPFPVQRASQLASSGPQTQWLVEDLWTEQAVGILGGEPKCCKSFLALDVAVSVASGTACLRQFPVRRSGPVLLFPAEDSLAMVRQRLEGIAAAAQYLLCLVAGASHYRPITPVGHRHRPVAPLPDCPRATPRPVGLGPTYPPAPGR